MKVLSVVLGFMMSWNAQANLNCDNGFTSGGDDRFASVVWDQENLVINFHETTYTIAADEESWQPSQTAKDSYSLAVLNRLVTKWAEGEEYTEEINVMAVYNAATQQLHLTLGAYDAQQFYPRSEILNCKPN